MRNPNPTFGDSDFLFAASQSRLIAERRYEKEYDEQSPSSLLLPNNTKCSSLSRTFNNAASAEVLRLWRDAG